MRYTEIISGVRVPISQEEQDILSSAKDGYIARDDLDERAREVARLMTSRGLIRRTVRDNKVFYRILDDKDLWRM